MEWTVSRSAGEGQPTPKEANSDLDVVHVAMFNKWFLLRIHFFTPSGRTARRTTLSSPGPALHRTAESAGGLSLATING